MTALLSRSERRPFFLRNRPQPIPLSEIPEHSESATRVSLLLRMRDVSDNGSWREFVECYGPRVLGWCRKCGLQEADAADATQMVLLKLVHSATLATLGVGLIYTALFRTNV